MASSTLSPSRLRPMCLFVATDASKPMKTLEGLLKDGSSRNSWINSPRTVCISSSAEDDIRCIEEAIHAHRKNGRIEAAILLGRRLVTYCSKKYGALHPRYLQCMSDLTLSLFQSGRVIEAETLERSVLKTRSEVLGITHPATMESLLTLSNICYTLGDPVSAYELWVWYLNKEGTITRRICDGTLELKDCAYTSPQSYQILAGSSSIHDLLMDIIWLENLATCCMFQCRLAEAEEMMLEAWYLRSTYLAGDEAGLAQIQEEITLLYDPTSRYSEALLSEQYKALHAGCLLLKVRRPLVAKSLVILQQPSHKKGRKRLGLLGSINGKVYSALADTGSELNVMSGQMALELGLTVWPIPKKFTMGNSRATSSIGYTQIEWKFERDVSQTKYLVGFHILVTSIFDIVLGDKFLMRTKVLTDNRTFLEVCPFKSTGRLSLSFLGSPRRRLEGSLQINHESDTLRVKAIPDTGAEANFMSKKLAFENGFSIEGSSDYVQFADGTEELTLGHVDLFWTFSPNQPQCHVRSVMPIKLTFHILEECRGDVIIGQDLLHSSDLFNQFSNYLVTVGPDNKEFELLPFGFRKSDNPSTEEKQGKNFVSSLSLRFKKTDAAAPKNVKKANLLAPPTRLFEDELKELRRQARKNGATDVDPEQQPDLDKLMSHLLDGDSKELERQAHWDKHILPVATEEWKKVEQERRDAYEKTRVTAFDIFEENPLRDATPIVIAKTVS